MGGRILFLQVHGDDLSTMNATNTILCWTPETAHVGLVPWPDHGDLSRCYMCTALAPWVHVRKMNAKERQLIVFSEAMSLIVRDKCDPMAVHQALLSLDEYRDGCAEDMPGMRI